MSFDREADLSELLSGEGLESLGKSLAGLLGEDYALVSSKGEWLLGRAGEGRKSISIRLELEPLGHLEASCDEARLRGAAGLVTALLKEARRYHMASELHLEAVHADYEALQEKHHSLLKSEEKYRKLAAELDLRVKEQVRTIETAQRQLYQAEKLASVGQLAAGVAHEINNPLGFVRSNLATAGSYLKDLKGLSGLEGASVSSYWKANGLDFVLEDFAQLLEESVTGVDRVARIVSNLKDFSSVDGSGKKSVDLCENLRSVGELVSGQAGGRIEFEYDLSPLPPFSCFPGHINQMLLNILMNAVQSIEGGGRIRIFSRFESGEILIGIADDGCGIPDEAISRVFDPFYTTRVVGSGTGLGLTVSRDIATAHGGSIGIESAPGRGTEVRIRFPAGGGK
ncbi:MAG: two-component sensor histidine kinase [Burkholderiales bacterium]|nr:two-component sensor histidine kinase [Burkholderiales bacterium]